MNESEERMTQVKQWRSILCSIKCASLFFYSHRHCRLLWLLDAHALISININFTSYTAPIIIIIIIIIYYIYDFV